MYFYLCESKLKQNENKFFIPSSVFVAIMYKFPSRSTLRERGEKITVENDDEGKTRNGASRQKKSTTAWNRCTKSLPLLKSLPLGMDVRHEARPVPLHLIEKPPRAKYGERQEGKREKRLPRKARKCKKSGSCLSASKRETKKSATDRLGEPRKMDKAEKLENCSPRRVEGNRRAIFLRCGILRGNPRVEKKKKKNSNARVSRDSKFCAKLRFALDDCPEKEKLLTPRIAG